jgi:hypothetical protein
MGPENSTHLLFQPPVEGALAIELVVAFHLAGVPARRLLARLPGLRRGGLQALAQMGNVTGSQ